MEWMNWMNLSLMGVRYIIQKTFPKFFFLREKTVLFNDQQNDPSNQIFPTEW